MKRFSRFIQESIELEEQKMTFQDAEKLKSKHLAAMQHHKKNGNSKGYAAHSMVVDKFEDAYDRHGTGVIPVGRIMSASQKAFKDHPHSNVKESVELDEGILKSFHSIANKPWSQSVKDSKNTAGEYSQIAKGEDFTVWTGYSGSLKKQAHYVVRDDKIIGSGWTMNSALKDAGLKDADLTHRSKFAAGSILNKGMKEEAELDEAGIKTTYGTTKTNKYGGGMSSDEKRIIPKRGTKAYDAWRAKNDEMHKRRVAAQQNEEAELDEAAMPIALKTFAMGARRVGQRLVQLHDDIKRIENVDQRDIVDEMNAIKKEFDGLMASVRKTAALLKSMKTEETELEEAVEVSHDRYMRSHGKKASGGEGNWMFTHKRMGDANVNDPKEVHTARGKFSDAKKSAQQWAKKHGHSTVYVMEEVEQIDENIKNLGDRILKFHATTKTPHGTYSQEELRKEHERRTKYDSIYRNAKPAYTKEEADVNEASKEHLERLKSMLDKAKPGSADHSQIRQAISSMYGDKHIPAKHRNVKPDAYDY